LWQYSELAAKVLEHGTDTIQLYGRLSVAGDYSCDRGWLRGNVVVLRCNMCYRVQCSAALSLGY
jgi:hypothetical protein